MATHGIVPDRAARATRGGLTPVARRLHDAGVTANAVTGLGVTLTVVGAALVALDRPLAALAVLLIGSIADTLDGAIARVSGGGTKLGAFLDSTADRVADAALFGAAIWLGASKGDDVLLLAALAAMPLSFFVPYARAKAESLGVSATVGPAPREARLVILIAGIAAWALLGLSVAFTTAIVAVAILAAITFVQRVIAVWRALARG